MHYDTSEVAVGPLGGARRNGRLMSIIGKGILLDGFFSLLTFSIARRRRLVPRPQIHRHNPDRVRSTPTPTPCAPASFKLKHFTRYPPPPSTINSPAYSVAAMFSTIVHCNLVSPCSPPIASRVAPCIALLSRRASVPLATSISSAATRLRASFGSAPHSSSSTLSPTLPYCAGPYSTTTTSRMSILQYRPRRWLPRSSSSSPVCPHTTSGPS